MLLLRHCQEPVVFRLERLIKNPVEGNAWHADHILAVADGGGEPFRKQLTFEYWPSSLNFIENFLDRYMTDSMPSPILVRVYCIRNSGGFCKNLIESVCRFFESQCVVFILDGRI